VVKKGVKPKITKTTARSTAQIVSLVADASEARVIIEVLESISLTFVLKAFSTVGADPCMPGKLSDTLQQFPQATLM